MSGVRRVSLLSDDLMFRSQLEAAVVRCGGELRPAAVGGQVGEVDAVFVDLNADSGRRLGFIATLREAQPALSIVAFCHHGEKELREAAMRVGATGCITNGALQAAAVRLCGVRVGGVRRR
jgi:DNA-binding NarL/FixJ family response regulator